MKIIKEKKKIQIPKRLRRLRWGVAGCGHFLENTFLPTLQQAKRSQLVSVYSSTAERANFIASKFTAEEAYSDYDEFLKSDFDMLYVSSANAHHYEQVIKAAKAGKNILCEKPLALTSEQAKEMIDVCEENGVFLTVNYVYRFHPLIVKARDLVENNLLGKILSISTQFNIDFPPNDNFRFNKELSGGGALRDLGTHMIDLLRFFGGEISEVTGFLDNAIYTSEVEDFATGLVKFEKGGYGGFQVSYSSKKSFNRIEITGYKGSISIENLIGKKNVPAKLIIDLDGESRKIFRKRANKLLYLIRSVQKAYFKNQPLQVTGYDGYINIKLMEELERQWKKD